MDVIAAITETLRLKGEQQYGNESVSQLAHALQSAALAESEGATSSLIAASLLHDIGHLIDKRFEAGQQKDVDRHHEDIGAAYLSRFFPAEVTEPIRLHVPAKRYLCHVEQGYFESLSPASVRSLRLQGGAFSADEAADFISQPQAVEAVRLRRWDDMAKVQGLETPALEHFMSYVVQVHAPADA